MYQSFTIRTQNPETQETNYHVYIVVENSNHLLYEFNTSFYSRIQTEILQWTYGRRDSVARPRKLTQEERSLFTI